MNKLLTRQIQKHYSNAELIPESLHKLLAVISESYDHYEKDRKLIERSIDLSSNEMIELNLELKREKEELRKAQKELNTLFENIDEVIFSVDMVENKLMQMSAGCEKIFGYTLEAFFEDRDLWRKVIHPDDIFQVNQQFNDLRQGRSVFNQYRIVHKDKNVRWVEQKVMPTLNESGWIVRLDGVISDITNRKNAESEQKKSFSIIEATLESTADGILVVNNQGEIVKFNNKFLELWRMPREILESREDHKSINFVLDQLTDPEAFVERINQLYASGEEVDFDLVHFKDGRVFERYSQPQMIDNKCVGRVWSFRDVTKSKNAEKAILISNERFNLVAKATSDIIWDWDLATDKVIRASDNMKKILGYDFIDANETASFWPDLIHPEDLPKINKHFETVFSNPSEMHMDSEYRVLKADGKYAYIYDKGFIVRDNTGKPIRVIGASQDMTKLKEHELQLQKHAKELAVSNEELEQFAYVASHDLQEPLRMVTSFLTKLEKKYSAVLDDKGKKYIDFAVDGAKRMRQIILDLLDYSRVGRSMDALENIDLNELLKEIRILLRKEIKDRQAAVVFNNLPVLIGYSSPLQQVFRNLIGNALKYSRADTPPIIIITADELIHHWQFSITDNGIGIDEEFFDRIFVIFQRLHNKDEYSGTGIGLAITKKIIENMGGKIWLSSEKGKGSTFYLTIQKYLS